MQLDKVASRKTSLLQASHLASHVSVLVQLADEHGVDAYLTCICLLELICLNTSPQGSL